MNRLIKSLAILIQGIILYLYLKLNIIFPCLFLKYLHIKCPTCGMTRAFLEIFNLNLGKALTYNLLSIPLFILILVSDILLIIDIILDKKYLNNLYNKIFSYYQIIIVILIINMLINNVK